MTDKSHSDVVFDRVVGRIRSVRTAARSDAIFGTTTRSNVSPTSPSVRNGLGEGHLEAEIASA